VNRRSAISVDLDSLPHYCRIHGLSESILDDRARGLVATHAVPRFLELFEKVSARGTFFAIGQDLVDPRLVSALQKAHASGVEIASHSDAHDYALSRLSRGAIDLDLAQAEKAIIDAVGVRPVGFRAPGYTLSPDLLQAIAARGYAYDSSAFPAAPYYAAKALVMGALRLMGQPSSSVLDSPRVLLAPKAPYRPSLTAPYTRGDAPLWELPMAVSGLGVPFIGTFAVAMPWPLVRAVYSSFKAQPFFNFELHALDVLDGSDGLPRALLERQRDARIPAARKMERLEQIFRWMGQDSQRLTLAEVTRSQTG
jgi:peptidoglycan-N-acetylglucosamine deacetylase